MNTASRMEFHGHSGITQITLATHELIRDVFSCEPQGTVNVKGKGEIRVWYVTAKHADSPDYLPEPTLQAATP